MRHFLRTMCVTLFALAAFVVPVSVGDGAFGTDVAQAATWRAYTKCQLVRISPNSVVGYVEGYGYGTNESAARNASLRDANENVPAGHYKRHCQTTASNRTAGGGRF